MMTMLTVIQIVNLFASFASAGWAVFALIRPGSLSRSMHSGSGETFYMRMYAARVIPLGLVCGILPFYRAGSVAALVLFIAAAAQIADLAIALRKKDRRMAIGASAGTVAHVLCGLAISA